VAPKVQRAHNQDRNNIRLPALITLKKLREFDGNKFNL